MKKIYGYKTIVSFLLGIIWVYIFTFRHSIFVFSAVTAIILLITILFVPLIIFGKDSLRVLSFSPFTSRVNIPYKDVSKATIHAGDFHCKLTLHTHDGQIKTTHSFLRYYDMEGLYNEFKERNVTITSTGVRAIEWPV